MGSRVRTCAAFATLLLLATSLLAGSVYGATIRGTIRSETLRGTLTADRMLGLSGNDKLYGFAGNDFLSGGSGRDLIDGGKGNDNLVGGSESDLIRGGSGNDSILSRDGVRDLVNCGPGRDVVGVDLRDRVSGCEVVRKPLLPPTVTDLAVTLTAPPDPVALNTDLTYVATVANAGSDPAITVGLSFAVPSGVTYIGASTATGSCQLTTPTVSCPLGAIAPGTALTASLVIRVLAGTTVVVAASASTLTQDSNPTNNSASVTSNVSTPPPPPPPPPTNCDPSYPTVCIPPPPPDLSCSDIPQYRNFTVLPPDPHGFDGNKDGIGCES